MKLICFGYLKICDKTTGKVLLGKPIVSKSAYFEVDLEKVIEDIGLDNVVITLDKRALKKLKGDSLILKDRNREGRVSLAGVDISKTLVITDLEQYFIASTERLTSHSVAITR